MSILDLIYMTVFTVDLITLCPVSRDVDFGD